MTIDSKLRHDFINNGLRIEVLIRMINEDLEIKDNINNEYIADLHNFLNLHLELIEQIKPSL